LIGKAMKNLCHLSTSVLKGTILSQEIGWEELLQNGDLYCVGWHVNP